MLNKDILAHFLIIANVNGKREIHTSDMDILFSRYKMTDDEKRQVVSILKSKSVVFIESAYIPEKTLQSEEDINQEDPDISTCADMNDPTNELSVEEELALWIFECKLISKYSEDPEADYQKLYYSILKGDDPGFISRYLSLTSRERKVICFRFTPSIGGIRSLEETAAKFGITTERVKMIQRKMLRHFHPTRTKRLKAFLNCQG